MSKKTEVAKVQGGALADPRLTQFSDMMDETDVDVSDIIIPKMLTMQGLSEFVAEDKAKAGQIVGSLDGNLIADKGEQVEIILFHRFKTWINFKIVGGKEEFDSIENFTAQNANLPTEEGDYKRYQSLNFYCLIAEDLKKESFLPYVVSFKSTNYKTGRAIETFRAKMKEFGKPFCFKTMKLGTKQVENDKGKFYINTVEEGRDTTDQELSKVRHWFSMIKESNIKVDDSAERKEKKEADYDADGDY